VKVRLFHDRDMECMVPSQPGTRCAFTSSNLAPGLLTASILILDDKSLCVNYIPKILLLYAVHCLPMPSSHRPIFVFVGPTFLLLSPPLTFLPLLICTIFSPILLISLLQSHLPGYLYFSTCMRIYRLNLAGISLFFKRLSRRQKQSTP